MKLSTALDVLGLMLLVVALAVQVGLWTTSFTLALVVAGLGVLAVSYIADMKGRTK